MKTQLRLRPHSVLPDQQIIEIVYQGRVIGTVTGADGIGVRVLSRHKLRVMDQPASIPAHPDPRAPIAVMEQINCITVMVDSPSLTG